MTSGNALTVKQQRFVEEYLLDLNATQAAIRAGYVPTNADVTGPRMLRNVRIAVAVQDALAERTQRTQVSQDRVVRELAALAFSNMLSFMRWGPEGVQLLDSKQMRYEDAACVVEVVARGASVRLRLSDKVAALRLLGLHLGLFGGIPAADEDGQPSCVILGGQRIYF